MITRLAILLVLIAGMAVPTAASAAYDFQPGGTIPQYVGRIGGPELRTSTISPSQLTSDWLGFTYGTTGNVAECAALAAAQGLAEDSDIWCVQKDIPNKNFNNCVYTCQGGQGGPGQSPGSVYTTQGSITTYIYSVAPTYYTAGLGESWPQADCGNPGPDQQVCIQWSTTYDAPVPTATLLAAPATIASGDTTTLYSTCTDSGTATIDNGVGYITLTTLFGNVKTGTNTVTPSSTTTYTLTCFGNGGTATASATVTVGNGPDLVGQLMNVISSATVGETKTFFPGAMNIGNASTGASFTNLLQIDNDSDHTSIVVGKTVTSAALAAAGTSNGQTGYTFGAAGTWYVRACADSNTSMTGTITESNESNNCTSWSPITVVPVTSNAAVMCSVSDATVNVGESVTYTATPSGGASAPYAWVASDGASGFGTGSSVTRSFSANGSYAMRVSATGAPTAGFCPNVAVGSGATCPGATTPTITASPNRAEPGSTVTLTWSGSNVNGSCTLTGTGGVNQTVSAGGTCSVAPQTTTVTVTNQSTYTLTCDGETDSEVVNVIPHIEEF